MLEREKLESDADISTDVVTIELLQRLVVLVLNEAENSIEPIDDNVTLVDFLVHQREVDRLLRLRRGGVGTVVERIVLKPDAGGFGCIRRRSQVGSFVVQLVGYETIREHQRKEERGMECQCLVIPYLPLVV